MGSPGGQWQGRGAHGASPSLAGMGQNPPVLCQLSGSSFHFLAGLELPSLTCGLETFPVKEEPGKSHGVLALNVKSMEMLEKPWLLPWCRREPGLPEGLQSLEQLGCGPGAAPATPFGIPLLHRDRVLLSEQRFKESSS